jgi:MFS family permease
VALNRNIEKEYLMLRIMTFVRYFGDCLFYGFFYLFLESRGLSESIIGSICAITPIVALICNPIWNHISKNANSNRKIMAIITAIEGIFILMFTQVSMVELLALLTCLTAIVGSPFYSLHDGFTATFANTYEKDYTKIRFVGTFAYFCGTIVSALLLKLTSDNYNILLYISGILFISVTLFFTYIKPIELKKNEVGEVIKRDYNAVLKNKTFIFYMIVYFLVVTVSFASDNFVGLFFTKELETSSSVWSLVFGAIILCEFIVMLVLSRNEKLINENIIWIIITLLYPLRSLLFALGIPLPFAIIAALLRGISYGLILVVNIRCLEKIVGLENVTTAFFVMAIFTAIIQAISNFVFGNIIEVVGYKAFFAVVAVIGFTGAIINLIYQFKNKFKYNIKNNGLN